MFWTVMTLLAHLDSTYATLSADDLEFNHMHILNKKNIMRATERKVYFEVVEQHVHEYVYKYWRNAYTRMKVYKISNTRGTGLFGDA